MGILHGDLARKQEGPGLLRGSCWAVEAVRVCLACVLIRHLAPRTLQAFKEIQKLLNKTHGKTVGDVMTPHPLAVRPMTNLEDAAR
jgi:CBS domain-containing protein